MKKYLLMTAAVAALAFTSCNNTDVKADLKTDVDSLAYNLGVAQSESLRQYMTMQLGVDSTQLDAFIKGLKEGATQNEDKSRDAYLSGIQTGKQVKQMAKGMSNEVYAGDSTMQVNPQHILAGLVAGLTHKSTKSAEDAYNDYQKNLQPIIDRNTEKKYGDNKKAGEDFLAKNKTKEGVVTLPSGLQYKVIKAGNGPMPNDSSTVTFNYTGKLIDGTQFDSSRDENRQPLELRLDRKGFIEGVTEAIKLMPQGSVWEVYIPYNLAYGSRPAGQQIKPFSALIFELESMTVTNKK